VGFPGAGSPLKWLVFERVGVCGNFQRNKRGKSEIEL